MAPFVYFLTLLWLKKKEETIKKSSTKFNIFYFVSNYFIYCSSNKYTVKKKTEFRIFKYRPPERYLKIAFLWKRNLAPKNVI